MLPGRVSAGHKNRAVAIIFGSGDQPVVPLLWYTVETANEGIDSPNQKPQSPFAFDKRIASTEVIDCSHPHVLLGSRYHGDTWERQRAIANGADGDCGLRVV
jgi:hypothetical protein